MNGTGSTPPAPVGSVEEEERTTPPQRSLDGTGTEAAGICRRLTHQEALELLGLGDVNPAVFLDHLDVFDFIVESGSVKQAGRETKVSPEI